MNLRLIDPESDNYAEITTPNTTGEICVSSPALFHSYLISATANSNATSQSKPAQDFCLPTTATEKEVYYRTGDLGYIDENNEWHLVGRASDNFKVAYEHVNAEELAAILAQHELVQEAAIVPVRTEDEIDPKIRAFVVLRNSDDMERDAEQSIIEWVNEKVATHKRITGGVRFVENLARNAMGKVLRWKLDMTP